MIDDLGELEVIFNSKGYEFLSEDEKEQADLIIAEKMVNIQDGQKIIILGRFSAMDIKNNIAFIQAKNIPLKLLKVFIQRFSSGDSSLHLAESFYDSLGEFNSVKIPNSFGLGYVQDVVLHNSFGRGFDFVLIKDYLAYLTSFLTHLAKESIIEYPFEVDYGTSEEAIVVQFVVHAENPFKDRIEQLLKMTGEDGSRPSQLFLALHQAHLVDVFYFKKSRKMVFSAMWIKNLESREDIQPSIFIHDVEGFRDNREGIHDIQTSLSFEKEDFGEGSIDSDKSERLDKGRSNLRHEIEEKEKKIQEMGALFERIKGQIKDMSRSISGKDQELRDVKQENIELQNKLKKFAENIQIQDEKQEASNSLASGAVNDEMEESFRRELEEKEEKLKKMGGLFSGLKARLESDSRNAEELARIRAENEGLREKLGAFAERLPEEGGVREEFEEIKKGIVVPKVFEDTAKALAEELGGDGDGGAEAVLRKELEQKEEKLKKMGGLFSGLKARLESDSRNAEELARIRAENEGLREKLGTLADKLSEGDGVKEEIEDIQKNIAIPQILDASDRKQGTDEEDREIDFKKIIQEKEEIIRRIQEQFQKDKNVLPSLDENQSKELERFRKENSELQQELEQLLEQMVALRRKDEDRELPDEAVLTKRLAELRDGKDVLRIGGGKEEETNEDRVKVKGGTAEKLNEERIKVTGRAEDTLGDEVKRVGGSPKGLKHLLEEKVVRVNAAKEDKKNTSKSNTVTDKSEEVLSDEQGFVSEVIGKVNTSDKSLKQDNDAVDISTRKDDTKNNTEKGNELKKIEKRFQLEIDKKQEAIQRMEKAYDNIKDKMNRIAQEAETKKKELLGVKKENRDMKNEIERLTGGSKSSLVKGDASIKKEKQNETDYKFKGEIKKLKKENKDNALKISQYEKTIKHLTLQLERKSQASQNSAFQEDDNKKSLVHKGLGEEASSGDRVKSNADQSFDLGNGDVYTVSGKEADVEKRKVEEVTERISEKNIFVNSSDRENLADIDGNKGAKNEADQEKSKGSGRSAVVKAAVKPESKKLAELESHYKKEMKRRDKKEKRMESLLGQLRERVGPSGKKDVMLKKLEDENKKLRESLSEKNKSSAIVDGTSSKELKTDGKNDDNLKERLAELDKENKGNQSKVKEYEKKIEFLKRQLDNQRDQNKKDIDKKENTVVEEVTEHIIEENIRVEGQENQLPQMERVIKGATDHIEKNRIVVESKKNDSEPEPIQEKLSDIKEQIKSVSTDTKTLSPAQIAQYERKVQGLVNHVENLEKEARQQAQGTKSYVDNILQKFRTQTESLAKSKNALMKEKLERARLENRLKKAQNEIVKLRQKKRSAA